MTPRIPDADALYALFGAAFTGDISESDHRLLEQLLQSDSSVRKLWFEYADVECGLRELCRTESTLQLLTQAPAAPKRVASPGPAEPQFAIWPGLAWAAAAVLTFGMSESLSFRSDGTESTSANFGAMQDALWASPENVFRPGDCVRTGQTLELLSGTVELKFRTGAALTLYAPAIFQVTSANGGFLTFGKVKVLAATPRAKGFAIQTPTARVVDVGTEFMASAAEDGQSRVQVRSGEVFVHVPGKKEATHLLEGQELSTDAHQERVTVRMESGDGSNSFRLPSIEPPSSIERATLPKDLSAARLLGAQTPLDPVLLSHREEGRILVDLGRPVSVTKINAYSWYKTGVFENERSRVSQNFELYGSDAASVPEATESPAQNGWELIGRVDADHYFGPGEAGGKVDQQACSFTAASGCIGRYRYLLCVPLRRAPELAAANSRTLNFFDVYSEPWTF